MLVPGVGRNGEVAVGVPLEGLLAVLVDPDRGASLALEDEDQLVIDVPDRLRVVLGLQLVDVRIVEAAGPLQVDEDAGPAARLPRNELLGVDVLHGEPAQGRQPLGFLPSLVG